VSIDYAGKGYATEALVALLPAIFEIMPSACEGGTGYDYVDACTDKENKASQRVLIKAGFSHYETVKDGFNSPSLGLRDIVWYRIDRPGTTLELPRQSAIANEDDAFIPPLQ
jgi:[ribosomal protein S5]-alanine N-acetyltransferase